MFAWDAPTRVTSWTSGDARFATDPEVRFQRPGTSADVLGQGAVQVASPTESALTGHGATAVGLLGCTTANSPGYGHLTAADGRTLSSSCAKPLVVVTGSEDRGWTWTATSAEASTNPTPFALFTAGPPPWHASPGK